MQRITELKRLPKVGKYYLVPHATIQTFYNGDNKEYLVPVFPNLHTDPELSESVPAHYHPDFRFLKQEGAFDFMRYKPGFLEGVYRRQRSNVVFHVKSPYSNTHLVHTRLKWKKAKCLSTITGVDIPRGLDNESKFVTETRFLRSYEGKKAVKGVCPHRGHNLSQCRAHRGIIECPLHGLQFKKETMEVVKMEDRI